MKKTKKIVSLIPARGGSKGLPNKNLYNLCGKPLIEYAINASKYSSIINETYVSTEDHDIKDFSLSKGVMVIDRPPEIASDTSSTEEAMMHFAEQIDFDIIVLIQLTSPLISSQQLDDGINQFISHSHMFNSAMTVINTDDILLWENIGNRSSTSGSNGISSYNNCKPLNYDPNNRGRRQDRKSSYFIETGGFFITTKEQLISTNCRISGNIMFIEVPFWTMFQVDSLLDLKMIEKLMK